MNNDNNIIQEKLQICMLKLFNSNNLRLFGCLLYNFEINIINKNKIILNTDLDNNNLSTFLEIKNDSKNNKTRLIINLTNVFIINSEPEEIIFNIIHHILYILTRHNERSNISNYKNDDLYNLASQHIINELLINDINNKSINNIANSKNNFIINELINKNISVEEVYKYLNNEKEKDYNDRNQSNTELSLDDKRENKDNANQSDKDLNNEKEKDNNDRNQSNTELSLDDKRENKDNANQSDKDLNNEKEKDYNDRNQSNTELSLDDKRENKDNDDQSDKELDENNTNDDDCDNINVNNNNIDNINNDIYNYDGNNIEEENNINENFISEEYEDNVILKSISLKLNDNNSTDYIINTKIDNNIEDNNIDCISKNFVYELKHLIENNPNEFRTNSGKLKELINKLIKVEIDWSEILNKIIKSKISFSPDNRSWARLNKRLQSHKILLPGLGVEYKPNIAILLIDTSGSISHSDICKFADIIIQTSTQFEKIRIIKHDVLIRQDVLVDSNQIRRHDILFSYCGRGGTSHKHCFNEIEKIYLDKSYIIDLVICLTDFQSDIIRIWPKYEWSKNNRINFKVIKIQNPDYCSIKIPSYIDDSPIIIENKK